MDNITNKEFKYLLDKINHIIRKVRVHDNHIEHLCMTTSKTCDSLDYFIQKLKILEHFIRGSGFKWIIGDIKNTGFNGGENIINQWAVRELNNIKKDNNNDNNDNSVTLNNNTIKFKAGTYKVCVKSIFANTGSTRIKLYDIINNRDLAISLSYYLNPSLNNIQSFPLEIDKTLTFDKEETEIQLQYYTSDIFASGLGNASGIIGTDEMFTTITIEKVFDTI